MTVHICEAPRAERVGGMTVTLRDKDMRENVLVKKVGHSLPKPFRSALNCLAGSSGLAFGFIFIVAFGVRAYSLRHIPVINLLPKLDRELGAIARSLAETGRFADPYMIPTGPTAHLPPIPPAILAFVYYWFGHTNIAGYTFIGFTIVTISTIYALMPWIADKLGAGRPAGLVGGLIGACMIESELSDHGESLAALLLGLMLVTFLIRWNNKKNSLITSLLFGLGIGISFHIQPVFLLVFLGCSAFEIGWRHINGKPAMSGMLALGVVLACVPWAWRNYSVFHEFFFIRSNLGLELRMGNHEGATAIMQAMDAGYLQHPRLVLAEARQLIELGEVEYMRQALQDALVWILENPLEFLKLTFLRFIHFWFGPLYLSFTSAIIIALTILASLGAWRIIPVMSVSQRWLIMIPLATYPLIYYLVPYMPRYRIPIDWILFLLAGAAIWHWLVPKKVQVAISNLNK